MEKQPLDRKALVDEFWRLKGLNPSLSVRAFSNLKNIKYYTFRDWFRDRRYNSKWKESIEERMEIHSSICSPEELEPQFGSQVEPMEI